MLHSGFKPKQQEEAYTFTFGVQKSKLHAKKLGTSTRRLTSKSCLEVGAQGSCQVADCTKRLLRRAWEIAEPISYNRFLRVC